MGVRRNMLMLEHSGYGDRYVASQACQEGLSGDTTLSSLQGDVRLCFSGLAWGRRIL